MIRSIVRYTGALTFDTSKPDGTMRKVLDASRMASLGWRTQTRLEQGLREAYAALLKRTF